MSSADADAVPPFQFESGDLAALPQLPTTGIALEQVATPDDLDDPYVQYDSDESEDATSWIRPPSDGSESELSGDDTPLDAPNVRAAPLAPIFDLPECVKSIRQDLLGGYTPGEKPTEPFAVQTLTASQSLSLRHYIAWQTSNGTVRAYNEHRAVLEMASGMEILTLYRVRKLALKIARLKPQLVDMCPKSCLAYTGPHADKESCPYTNPKTKIPCNHPRRRNLPNGQTKPAAQVTILPIIPSIQAILSTRKGCESLETRDRCLKEVLKVANAARRYSDFPDGSVHETQARNLGLFQDSRDVALALSSDGAQLTMKKQSSTWILIIILLNLPGDVRYQTQNVIINFAIPGPNVPSDIESFLWPLFGELARASEGIFLWDGLRSEWFLHRSYVVMFLGDMLGSAKVNGMSGHSAVRGDRFTTVEAARSSIQKGSKAQYYPLNPPDNASGQYNPHRPTYGPENLPMRKQEDYWATLKRISDAKTATEKATISRSTGVSKIPIAVALPGFIHPSFFPLDPFHLFYENCMPWIWDIMTLHAKSGEPVHVLPDQAKAFGEHVSQAMRTLPPAFCGNIRDPFLKRQSQYKAYEWMALLHWYFLPIGLELEFNSNLLHVFSSFAYIVDYAMTIKSRSEADLIQLRSKISTFLTQFEQLFVGDDPEKIQRCRLCVFQLIHVPIHIKWYGSIRLGSQATCERTIGEMGHQIKSKKDPFANLTNIIIERESTRLVQLYHPELVSPRHSLQRQGLSLHQALPFKFPETPADATETALHLGAIRSLYNSENLGIRAIERFGKATLSNGHTLRSLRSELTAASSRLYRWFEVGGACFTNFESLTHDQWKQYSAQPGKPQFGEALAFYSILVRGETRKAVVFRPLSHLETPLPTVIRGRWPPEHPSSTNTRMAIDISAMISVVGIWEPETSKNVYVLRKHPALELCSPSDIGLVDDMDRERGEDDDE